MTLRHIKSAPLAALILLVAHAAPPAPAPYLTLAAAREQALARNADLRVAETQVAAAFAQRQGAHEIPNPTLGLSTSKLNTDHRSNRTDLGNGLLDRSFDTIVSLGQLIELGGKRGLRQASAASALQVAEAQRDDVRRLLLLAVTQAYVATVSSRDIATVRLASAASLRREAEIAGHRFAAGDISSADRTQIELAAGQLELDAAQARRDAAAAALLLETLLGEPQPTGTIALTASLAELVPLDLTNAASAPRPDLAAATANLAKADSDLDLARRGRVPDVTVSVQYERQPPDQPNTVGVGVSLPLPLWNRNGGAIAGARSARAQAAATLDKTRTQAAADVAGARIALATAAERAQRYAATLEPQSAAIAATLSYAYEHGGASLLEMLAAQRNHNDVRLAALLARADWLVASAALTTALNRPDPTVVDRSAP